IERQQKTSKSKNALSIGSSACSLINTASSGGNNCLNGKSSYERKIEEDKEANKNKENNMKK
ncbi:hypothetical protein, partial [Clostridioides difficile]|uniref:hypothetical protein n=1 Tax=Clostridioides difficile TaxID=1496 RepID=UPI0020B2153F